MAEYVLIHGQLYTTDELYHYGVKGMRWGHRKRRYDDNVYAKKAAYKQAKKDYKQSRKNREGWEDVAKKNTALEKAKYEYGKSKKDYDASPEGKAAAKARAKKAVKVGAAVAGTALAAYGAYKLNKWVKTKNCQIAAERGREHAEKYFFDMQLSRQRAFDANPAMKSMKFEVDVNADARRYARNAANDSFRTAAKNVRNYKKSHGSLNYLRDLDFYNYQDWHRTAARR